MCHPVVPILLHINANLYPAYSPYLALYQRESLSRLKSRGGTILIPKNHNSGSLGYFGGIGTGIGIKRIVKGIKKESDSNSSFHEQAE